MYYLFPGDISFCEKLITMVERSHVCVCWTWYITIYSFFYYNHNDVFIVKNIMNFVKSYYPPMIYGGVSTLIQDFHELYLERIIHNQFNGVIGMSRDELLKIHWCMEDWRNARECINLNILIICIGKFILQNPFHLISRDLTVVLVFLIQNPFPRDFDNDDNMDMMEVEKCDYIDDDDGNLLLKLKTDDAIGLP